MGKYNKPQKEVKFDVYPRFCSVCKKGTYLWECCGQRTRRLNMERTIGQIVSSENSPETPDLLRSMSQPDGVLVKALDGSQQAQDNCFPAKDRGKQK